jgi:hypothetical protein
MRCDGGSQCGLQRLGGDIGGTLHQAGVTIDLGGRGVLDRRNARFPPRKSYLAGDGIKYLRGRNRLRRQLGADTSGTSEGA